MAKRTRGQAAVTLDSSEPQPRSTEIRLSTQVGEETFTYYANYAEIACIPQEFAILFARMPTKLSPDKLDEALAGNLILTCDVQILIPTTMINGLIQALIVQKAAYEQQFGPIHTPGGINVEGDAK